MYPGDRRRKATDGTSTVASRPRVQVTSKTCSSTPSREAPSPSGKAEVCKTSTPGSNPGGASKFTQQICQAASLKAARRDRVALKLHSQTSDSLDDDTEWNAISERPLRAAQIMFGRLKKSLL